MHQLYVYFSKIFLSLLLNKLFQKKKLKERKQILYLMQNQQINQISKFVLHYNFLNSLYKKNKPPASLKQQMELKSIILMFQIKLFLKLQHQKQLPNQFYKKKTRILIITLFFYNTKYHLFLNLNQVFLPALYIGIHPTRLADLLYRRKSTFLL